MLWAILRQKKLYFTVVRGLQPAVIYWQWNMRVSREQSCIWDLGVNGAEIPNCPLLQSKSACAKLAPAYLNIPSLYSSCE